MYEPNRDYAFQILREKTTTMLTELQSSGSARQGFSIAGEKLTEYRARYCRDQVSQRDNAPNTLFGDDAFRKHLLRILLLGRGNRGGKVNRPLGSAKIATLFSTNKHTHNHAEVHARDGLEDPVWIRSVPI